MPSTGPQALSSEIDLLRRMIATPSFSRDEAATAQLIFDHLAENEAVPRRYLNNVYALSEGAISHLLMI